MDVHIPLVLGAADFFKEQVSTNIFLSDTFYGIATITLFLLVVAIGLIDAGLVQRKNLLDAWIGKLAAAFIAGLGMFLIGYAIWQGSFSEAFGIPKTSGAAISQWGGGFCARRCRRPSIPKWRLRTTASRWSSSSSSPMRWRAGRCCTRPGWSG